MEPFRPIELAPLVRQTLGESVFQGAGCSHFSFVPDQGFHVTTQIPGIGIPGYGGISIHDPVEPMFSPQPFFRPPGGGFGT